MNLLIKHKDLLLIICLFLIWRVYLFLVAYIAPAIINDFGGKFPYFEERLISSDLPSYIWSFGNFDGVHYIGISQHGYSFQFTQAFFPLYPLIISIVQKITGVSYLLSGLIVSNLCFLLSVFIFFNLVKKIFSKSTALWATIFLLAFPTSFFFGSLYTESLFFLLIISSFYYFYKDNILVASALGGFASSTRLVGIFLSVSLQKNKIKILPLIIVPIGLLTYMVYLYFKFDNPIYFVTSQAAFGQARTTDSIILLPQVLYRSVKQILTTNGLTLFNALSEFIFLLLTLVLLVIAWFKTKKEWVIYCTLAILTPTLTGSLASIPRYVLIAFPIYVVLALIKNTYIKISIVFLFITLLTVMCAIFTRGYWIA